MWRRLVGQEQHAARAQVDIMVFAFGLVERGEEVRQGEMAAARRELEDAVAEVLLSGIKYAIAGREVEGALPVGGGRPAGLPDAAPGQTTADHGNGVRGGVEHAHRLQGPCVVAGHPAVERGQVVVRGPGDVDYPVDQRQAGPLVLPQRS